MRFLVSIWLLCAVICSYGQPILVGPGGDYATLENAESAIGAGDTVIILDGTYSDGTQFLEERHGTIDSPIVIMAESKYGVIFDGGTEAIHLVNCTYLELWGIIFQAQTGNGVNIDDGGDYATPTHHIMVRDCIFRDMAASGNNDLLKLSGLDSFLIKDCQFYNGGAGGSGIDMVGCHWGVIEDNSFDNAGTTGIQAKGGTQHIRIQRNVLKDMNQRALNLGGSTGLQFFRPPLPDPIVDAFEAADLEVFSNVFIGSWAPIAYVGSRRVKVFNNTFYLPQNWVIRILQETTEDGFLPCGDNEFRNNIIYLENDLTEVNIGSNTDPGSFVFSNNLWFNNSSGSWTPNLPVTDSNQVIANPLFNNVDSFDFSIPANSPAVGAGKILPFPGTDFLSNYFVTPPSSGAFEGDSIITSIPYEILDSSITIRPNPASDRITIEGDFTNAQIQILDVNGIVVADYSNESAPLTIFINDLPNGYYFILLSNANNSNLKVERIIKIDE